MQKYLIINNLYLLPWVETLHVLFNFLNRWGNLCRTCNNKLGTEILQQRPLLKIQWDRNNAQ